MDSNLIKNGAGVSHQNANEYTSFHCATLNNNSAIIDELMKNKTDINQSNFNRNTILHKVSQWDYVKILNLIIKQYKSKITFISIDNFGRKCLRNQNYFDLTQNDEVL